MMSRLIETKAFLSVICPVNKTARSPRVIIC